ncbi:MAG: NUDIX domain-containing protein [Candidatus Saganbacteria bacterium]|nr:NUDIX domain-containing protein [Candidatus Saganbacteria bacterium]
MIEALNDRIPHIQSAHAILLLSGKYILQLRDIKPTIAAAGQWSLFGGMRKKGETPAQAIRREILEELLIEPPVFKYLWFRDYYGDFEKTIIRTWFFASDVSTVWPTHKLREGQDVDVFDFDKLADLIIPPVMRQTIERFQRLTNTMMPHR